LYGDIEKNEENNFMKRCFISNMNELTDNVYFGEKKNSLI